MKTETEFTDSIGPGTAAWIECDRAIELWHENKRRAAGCAMARMITHLRLRGRADLIQGWKDYIYSERVAQAD